LTDHGNGAASAGQPDLAELATDGIAAGSWVLDPAGSRVEFHVRHFWGAITVHGTFGQVTGEGSVSEDGTITGKLTMDAASLDTRNKQRDKHLRSADFFDSDNHGEVVVTVSEASPASSSDLAFRGTLAAAGHAQPIEFTAHVSEATAQSVVLTAEIEVNRTAFAMTWRPLGIASVTARGTVVARFVRP
jgi:polyisoprenoid-binding protein YceI